MMDQDEIELRMRCLELALRIPETVGADIVEEATRFFDFATGKTSAAIEVAADV